jgi:hypothetical protein
MKKIVLVAIAPEDGWGYIKTNNNYYLIRPPYPSKLEELPKVTESTINRAITFYGFRSCHHEFNDLDEVIKFLEKTYLDTKKGMKILSLEKLRKEFIDILDYLGNKFVYNLIRDVLDDIDYLINHYELLKAEKSIIKLQDILNKYNFEDLNEKLRHLRQECERKKKELERIHKKYSGVRVPPDLIAIHPMLGMVGIR